MSIASTQQRRALDALDHLLDVLASALAPGDIRLGWTDEARRHWLSWIRDVRGEVASGIHPVANLDVALDHNGIRGHFDPTRTPLSWRVSQAADALYDWAGAE
jgi:hypothetical protein